MDSASLQLGITVAGLVGTFFSKSVEEIAKRTAGGALDQLSRFVAFLRTRFANDSNAMISLASLEKNPSDQDARAVLAERVSTEAAQDPGLQSVILKTIEAVRSSKDDVTFSTEVRGNIEKYLQLVTNYGTITM